MQKIDFIQDRSFGEKLNELTGLIYENFADFVFHTRWYLIGFSLLLSAVIEWFPRETILSRSLCLVLLFALGISFVVAFATLVRKVGVEGCELNGFRQILPSLLVYERNALLTCSLPTVLLGLLGNWLLVSQTDDNKEYFIILLFFIFFVAQIVFVPIFTMIDVVVLEDKVGLEALRRTCQLLFCHFFGSVFFYFIITFIGLIIPLLSDLPLMLLNIFFGLVGNEFNVVEEPSILFQVIHFLLLNITVFMSVLYLMMVSLGTMLVYGDAVEYKDNVSFLSKFNNFDNL